MQRSGFGTVPKRRLGRTGEQVSMLGLGGFHLGEIAEEESIRLIRRAIDAGITFVDNCWDYHEGRSELRVGRALRDGREEPEPGAKLRAPERRREASAAGAHGEGGQKGEYEAFKTPKKHDGTVRNPHWLEEARL